MIYQEEPESASQWIECDLMSCQSEHTASQFNSNTPKNKAVLYLFIYLNQVINFDHIKLIFLLTEWYTYFKAL